MMSRHTHLDHRDHHGLCGHHDLCVCDEEVDDDYGCSEVDVGHREEEEDQEDRFGREDCKAMQEGVADSMVFDLGKCNMMV